MMTYDWILYFCLFLALWSAVTGGIFSAFSEFIMSALLRSAPASGIEAMQQINRTVIPTQFVAGILAIALFSVALGYYAWTTFDGAARLTLVLAPIVYLPTVFFMTLFGNVPMNNKLAQLDPNSEYAETYWRHYGQAWTRLNHVRSIGSLVTAGLFVKAALDLITSGQV